MTEFGLPGGEFISPDADPRFRTGSKVEIVPGRPHIRSHINDHGPMSGPRPPVVHLDEVELMSEEVWKASREPQVSLLGEVEADNCIFCLRALDDHADDCASS